MACCLSLELLEQAGQQTRISPALLGLVMVALLIAYLLYQLYAPMVALAYPRLDPVNGSIGQAQAQIFSYFLGHSLVCGGLAVLAGALRTLFTELAAADGEFGPPISTTTLLELCGGLAVCLTGQALFVSTTRWRIDRLRLSAAGIIAVLALVLAHLPALVTLLMLLAVCAGVLRLEDRRERRSAGRGTLRIWQWRPAVRFTGRDHELSGFELLFDVMAAFAFAQTDVLVLRDQTPEGALRGLLVLAMLWGCWMTYVWAANTADADAGTIRSCHVFALAGLVFLGLALPRAYVEPGLNLRVLVFLFAYLLTRCASACALWAIRGRGAGWQPPLVAVGSAATAVLIAVSTQMPQHQRIGLWLSGLGCEALAAYLFTRRWWVAAPAHLAERFAFIVVIGLDMSLCGMAIQIRGEPIGAPQLILIGLALINATVMWWLYFSTLQAAAEHRLTQADPTVQSAVHKRIAYGHYNWLHLVVLVGMVVFGFALRAIGRDLGPNIWGPRLPGLYCLAMGIGLATFTLALTVMWALQGRRPHGALLAVAAACLAAIPLTTHRRALLRLSLFVALGLTFLAAEARARTTTPTDTKQAAHGDLLARLYDINAPFESLDVDRDGLITWQDFTVHIHAIDDPALAHRAEVAYRALWTAMCEALDTNHDRVITQTEYNTYLAGAEKPSAHARNLPTSPERGPSSADIPHDRTDNGY
ncbi:low temperature requirement protein A [Streptomyces sp. NPDC001709]